MMKLKFLLIAAVGIILQDGSFAYPSGNKRSAARKNFLIPNGFAPEGFKNLVRVRRQDDEFTPSDGFGSGMDESGGPEFGMGDQGFGSGGQGFGGGGQGFGGGGQGFNLGGQGFGLGGQSGPGGMNLGNMQQIFSNIAQKIQGFFQKAFQSLTGMMNGAGGGQVTGTMPSGFDQQAGMM